MIAVTVRSKRKRSPQARTRRYGEGRPVAWAWLRYGRLAGAREPRRGRSPGEAVNVSMPWDVLRSSVRRCRLSVQQFTTDLFYQRESFGGAGAHRPPHRQGSVQRLLLLRSS